MTDTFKLHRIVIPEPFPETIGVSALTIRVPDDFRGEAEIIWWYLGKTADTDKQRMTCSTTWLLQGIFHNVQGTHHSFSQGFIFARFEARVIALVVHKFYQTRIEAASRLEAAYQWRPY